MRALRAWVARRRNLRAWRCRRIQAACGCSGPHQMATAQGLPQLGLELKVMPELSACKLCCTTPLCSLLGVPAARLARCREQQRRGAAAGTQRCCAARAVSCKPATQPRTWHTTPTGGAAQARYAHMILDGGKSVELRTYPIPEKYLGAHGHLGTQSMRMRVSVPPSRAWGAPSSPSHALYNPQDPGDKP